MSAHAALGLEAGATPQEVDAAYQRLALRYHPDMQDGDETMFFAVQEAHAALTRGGGGSSDQSIPLRKTVAPGTKEHKVITLQKPNGGTVREQVWIRASGDGHCNMFISPCKGNDEME